MNSFMKLFFPLIFACAIAMVEAQNACVTFTNESGKCVPWSQCSIHVNIFKTARNQLKPKMEDYLQRSLCNIINNVDFVCCAPRHMLVDNTTKASNIKKPDSSIVDLNEKGDFEDVVGHPSLSLLDQAKCGRVSGEKISNGNNSALGEFPWVAQLRFETRKGKVFRCGGSLISKRYVLTAAHCVKNIKNHEVSVRLGEYDTSTEVDCINKLYCLPPVQDISIEEVIIHPEFNYSKISNDIAVLRLKWDADINDENVSPICLPTTPTLQRTPLESLTFTGWGLTEKKATSDILKEATILLLPNKNCQQLYKRYHQITPRHICTSGENRVGSCFGDSGGPLFFWVTNPLFQYIQFGVIMGSRCDENYHGVHVRVTYYVKWILDQMRP